MVERRKRMRNIGWKGREREEREKPEVSQGGSKKLRHTEGREEREKRPETNVDKEKHTK